MSAPRTVTRDGKKFMWDGCRYATREAAIATAERYERDGFEVLRVDADEGLILYTRRAVKETAIAPP
jgi:hypothetical protein